MRLATSPIFEPYQEAELTTGHPVPVKRPQLELRGKMERVKGIE